MNAVTDAGSAEQRNEPAPSDGDRDDLRDDLRDGLRDDDRADTSSALRFTGVGKQFDDRWIVRGLDVDIPRGTILGLVGPSGCGKTTTVRLATGTYRPDEGEVLVLGSNPAAMPTAQRTAIGYLPQTPVLFDDLSLWENLNFHASLNGVPWRRRARLEEMMALVDLQGEERKLIRDASGGMQRRLALAAALVHDPALLILDEPTAGIDPLLRRQIWDHFRALGEQDRTLIVTTQHVNEAAHCDVVVVLDEGTVVAVGPPEELRRTAIGGDAVILRFAEPVDDEVLAELGERGCRSVDRIDRTNVRVVVEHSSSDVPKLLHRLEELGVEVEDSTDVPVDWDEVFIALIGPRERS
ncbi:MAG TPA: ABC transporter ATP-binding protein [Ilumatobacteraceae bacterium]|nr:ABC transporter ATP-binding protein [Ilumatobacteraceae bacterium]